MRRTVESSSLPLKEYWLRLPPYIRAILALAFAGGLGLIGYEALGVKPANLEASAAALQNSNSLTFADFHPLADELEQEGLFVPRFLLHEIPDLFLNELPQSCDLPTQSTSVTDLFSQALEYSLSASGAGDNQTKFVFSLSAQRQTCRDGRGEYAFQFTRGGKHVERQVFSDDDAGRLAMREFITGRFATLGAANLPELMQLRLVSSARITGGQLGELPTNVDDPLKAELAPILSALYGAEFSAEDINTIDIARFWSRAYYQSNTLPSPTATRIQITFRGDSQDYITGRVLVLDRYGDVLTMSGEEFSFTEPLDPARYPNLFAFMGSPARS